MSLTLLFPGQGSQSVGMGRELAQSFSAAADTFQEADDVLGFPLSTLAWEGPLERLTETRHAQPALLTHSIAVLRCLDLPSERVSFAAGHSLGEFSAHVASGTLSFADALSLVQVRGELMFQAGESCEGTMAAVLGLDDAAVEEVCKAASAAGGVCVPANFNSPGQVVISGDPATLERASTAARAAGARRVLPLTVSGAFHSPLMSPAREGLRRSLAAVTFTSSAFPVVSNVTAREVRDPEEIRSLLAEQLVSPVRWCASMEELGRQGATHFLELGPGAVLTGLARRILPDAKTLSVGTPRDVALVVDWLEGEG